MASPSRLALRRLPQVYNVSSRLRNYLLRAPAPSSLRVFSQFALTNTLPLTGERKPSNLFTALPFTPILQSRSYADFIVKVPSMAESISEGTLKQWQKKVGDYVSQDEEIATIETDKVDVAVNASQAGTITEIFAQEEDTVTVGQDLCKIEAGGAAPEGGKKEATAAETPKEPATPEREEQREPEAEQHSKQQKAPEPQLKPPPPPPSAPKEEKPVKQSHPVATEPYGNRGERRVKMTPIRRRIAERLKESQNTAAFVTTFQEVDMSAVMSMRSQYKEEILEKTGVRLGFMSFFCRASVLAMKEIPAVNASIEGEGNDLSVVFRDYIDISIAVAAPKGLVTPIVRNVETMDLIEIDEKIAHLGEKARANKLTLEDMAGGTFTISNGGVFGNLMGTPIINLPHTAVLGLHAVKDRPIALNGQVVIRPMMYLALTYDHRLLDGREAVTFLLRVKEYIEDPRRMLLTYNLPDE